MKPVEQGFIDPQDPRYITYAGRRMLRVIGAEDPPEPTPEVTPPAPEPPAAAAPTPGPGPWSAELEQRFADPEARAAADAYMREVVQPRITQLEQSQAPTEAAQLYADLNDPEKAAAAYLALTGELFDPEVAELVRNGLTDYYADPAEITDPEVTPPAEPPARDPEVQALIDRENQREYNETVASAVEKYEIPEAWQKYVHPLIVSHAGDIDVAAQALRADLEAQGVITTEPAPPGDPAPPVAGTTPAAVPTAKDYGGDIGAAIDDFVLDLRQQAPPPVGSV